MSASTKISQTRFESVDIFRLLCAIMVVTIHTQPLSEYGSTAGFIAPQVFPRIGVPFFFAAAGYFYIGSLLSGRNITKKYFFRLLRVYTIWSVVYFTIDFISLLRSGGSVWTFVKSCIYRYFIYGSSYHLWFFPALFFSLLVIVAVNRMKLLKNFSWFTLFLYIVGCIGCSYYSIGNNIPLVSNLINHPQFTTIRRVLLMGLPFFTMGYFTNVWGGRGGDISNKIPVFILPIAIFLWLLEIVIVVILKLQSSIVITIFMYPLLYIVFVFLIQHPLPNQDKLAHYSRITAGFMYFSHPILIIIVSKIWVLLFSSPITPTIKFIAVCAASLFGGLIIFKLNNKRIDKLVT